MVTKYFAHSIPAKQTPFCSNSRRTKTCHKLTGATCTTMAGTSAEHPQHRPILFKVERTDGCFNTKLRMHASHMQPMVHILQQHPDILIKRSSMANSHSTLFAVTVMLKYNKHYLGPQRTWAMLMICWPHHCHQASSRANRLANILSICAVHHLKAFDGLAVRYDGLYSNGLVCSDSALHLAPVHRSSDGNQQITFELDILVNICVAGKHMG